MSCGDKISGWALVEASIDAAILIGSRSRSIKDEIWRADEQSDWDFHLISSRPAIFKNAAWLQSQGLDVRSYVVRNTSIGNVPKALVVFSDAEADFVILSSLRLRLWRVALQLNLHRRSRSIYKSLQDLALVIRPGWKFLKGEKSWGKFYMRVVSEIADPRLDDSTICEIANGFIYDAVWILRKIQRGEWLAAQRMLHRSVADTNFKLLHELKLRKSERSFPDARRLERILTSAEYDLIRLSVAPEPESLSLALKKASDTCRQLVAELVGEKWHWPIR